MSPYREAAPRESIGPRLPWRSFFSKLRARKRWLRILAVGTYRRIFNRRCPVCDKPSWDPHHARRDEDYLQAVHRRTREHPLTIMNLYRCRHRGDLNGAVKYD